MKYFIFFILLGSLSLYAQKYNNTWTMGYGSGRNNMDFSGTSPISTSVGKGHWLQTTNSAICSPTTGKLLFYTNGQTIYNALEDSLQGTSGFNPNNWTNQNVGINCGQACLTLPFSTDTNLFYIFHSSRMYFTPDYCPERMYYSIIDMKKDNGKGGVARLNVELMHDTITMGTINACKHANGKDWWVLSVDYRNNCYIRFLIQNDSILGPFKQCIGNENVTPRGTITTFSPNGKRYATYQGSGIITLFDFDRCSGLLSNPLVINAASDYGAIEFSPNSNILYHSANAYFYQYDLTSNNIETSRILLDTWDGFANPTATAFYIPHLAADNKIYVTTVQLSQYLHVVNYPDSLGFACHFVQRGYEMNGYCSDYPPNYPHFRLGADTTLCNNLSITLPTLQNFVNIYPNPAQNEVTFEFSQAIDKEIILFVYDILGKQVQQLTIPKSNTLYKLNVSAYPQGVYSFQLQNGNVINPYGKFVIVR